MIELQHLTVGYGDRAVLSDISQTIGAGQMVCLLGSNGVGKSTILRTIAGFQPPLSGKVLLHRHDMTSLSVPRRSRVVSVVLTERIQVPYMKVADLVGMGRSPYTGFFGTLSNEDRRIAGDAIEMVGITSLAGRAIDTLSDGERQKVMLAKAIAQQTSVILLDEPTAFLDYHAKISILRLMLRLAHETGKTILLSTHDVEMALRLSDALWVVVEGKVHSGTTASLTGDGTLRKFLEPLDPAYFPTL